MFYLILCLVGAELGVLAAIITGTIPMGGLAFCILMAMVALIGLVVWVRDIQVRYYKVEE